MCVRSNIGLNNVEGAGHFTALREAGGLHVQRPSGPWCLPCLLITAQIGRLGYATARQIERSSRKGCDWRAQGGGMFRALWKAEGRLGTLLCRSAVATNGCEAACGSNRASWRAPRLGCQWPTGAASTSGRHVAVPAARQASSATHW